MTLYAASADEAHQEKQRAYEKRLLWMRALARVVLDHEPDQEGKCWCGDVYPCRTWRTLQRTSKGIHKQMEKWGSMPEEQLERIFDGEDFQRVLDHERWQIERKAQELADSRAGVDESLVYPPTKPLQKPSGRASSA